LVETPEVIGERRHLTVLFCDLVGSTAISAQLDPEEWRETVASYHRVAAEAITRFDGQVAKYLGDRMTTELQTPFVGLIRISSVPMTQALSVISR
jgi:class 3 adenylate cyclase